MHAVYPDEIKALSQHTSIPIVGSELLLTRWQLREWLEKHVSQILMTEPLWTGGVSETRKIANLAETYGVPIGFAQYLWSSGTCRVYASGRAHC